MPGLKQLQQFNTDIMTLGDEAKIRAARGEKPVFVSIPKNVQDIDDSDEFLDGLPMLSEEEQAQADAAAKEREREANDFSDFMDGEEDENSEEKQKTAPKQESVPDMSDLLPSDGGMDFGDFDLSEFEDKTPEPEPEPEPEEVAIEDMDLDSLLALSEQPKKEEPEEEYDLFGSDQQNAESETPTVDVSDDIFSTPSMDMTQTEAEPKPAEESDSLFGDSTPSAPGPDITAFDESLFDMPQETPAEEEQLPELDENSLASTLGSVGEFSDIPQTETAPEETTETIEDLEDLSDIPTMGSDDFSFEAPAFDDNVVTEIPLEENAGDADPVEIPADDFTLPEEPADTPAFEDAVEDSAASEAPETADDVIDDFSTDDMDQGVQDLSTDSFDFSTDGETSTDFGSFDAGNFDFSTDGTPPEASDLDLGLGAQTEVSVADDLSDPNSDFETSESVSLNDDLPTEFNEIPDIKNIPQGDASTQTADDGLGLDLPDFDNPSQDSDSSFENVDIDSIPSENTETADLSKDDFNAGNDVDVTADFDSTDFGTTDFGTSDDFSTDSLDGNGFDDTGTLESLSPEESVPEDDFGTSETFDTSDINNLDFSGETDSDFSLGPVDGTEGDDDFNIPGFSDTVTANFDKQKPVSTPDFSGAAEAKDDDKPKNTFTDTEYKRFLKNLATYPLNVRIALEDFVVKNEFTDDAIFSVLEKVLRKVPARQVASELEKLLDISLEVPRDYEKRSAAEYEAYKKSIEYQLKNKIIPGAIMTAAAAILVFCIFTLTNTFIVKPVRASNLYNQGYALLQDGQYPQSQDKFNKALTFRPVKKWFYTYAEGYRDHKQYDRSRLMYRSILQRYNHEKKAGLDWARMESEDLYNYEESERILKREVLDYHINDPEGILALGDLYLDWATDADSSKYPSAKQNYDLLVEKYGSNNLYMSRQMRYYIRTDNLRQVLMYKEIFMGQKKALVPQDEIELSGYMLDKRYGKLRPSEENLRSQIEDVRKLLERALKSAPEDAVALYNMARYFVETSSGKNAAKLLQASIDSFEKQTKRNKRDTYKYINAYRLLGEEKRNEREYLTAETLYGRGIEVFEYENGSSGFESDENVGRLYADLADLDYFIAADNEAALMHYENAVNNKHDTSSIRYRIGYIQYQNQNYPAALGSFIRSQDTSGNDIHLLLALANTLVLSSDNYVARGYYERLISLLEGERQKHGILFPQVREDQGDIVDTYMKASNNLGVTLSRIASNTGNSTLNAKAIVNLQESLRAWDALTRNQQTMIRLEGSNLAEQNVRYITHPMSDYDPEIYTEIPRMLYGEEGLE